MAKEKFEIKEAAKVDLGDMVANVGIVDAKNTIGVFTVLLVRGTLWTLANGRGDIVRRDLTLFSTDPVVIEVDPAA